MAASVHRVAAGGHLDAAGLCAALGAAPSGSCVIVYHESIEVDADAVKCLANALLAPLAATASPVPCAQAAHHLAPIPEHPRNPPAPTIPLPCPLVVAVQRDALDTVDLTRYRSGTWQSALVALAVDLVNRGWRHVAAPGVAMAWRSPPLPTGPESGGWSDRVVAEMAGEANEGLATHTLWARTRLTAPRVVIDGACLTDSTHNGTQALVIELAKGLRERRPAASVALAVEARYLDHVRSVVGPTGVHVVERRLSNSFDVVYRPYQLLDPTELRWIHGAAPRRIVGQLDMIGYSNPSYHPSGSLFHGVRNLQRGVMRGADGVVFISEFGRAAARAECPDLEHDRTAVIPCGAGAALVTPAPHLPPGVRAPFIFCLSATFWHKQRGHAIRVFAELCEHHGYDGSLVIAGPSPYYGSSSAADAALLASLPAAMAARVVDVGQIDEVTKWRLLTDADLVLYPSVVEGFGLVPFEAATAGTPCLAYAGTALAEVLGGSSPSLVDSWAPTAWAKAAAALVGEPAASADAVCAVGRTAQSFTWASAAESTWELIDDVLARPRREASLQEGGLRSRTPMPGVIVTAPTPLRHLANRLGPALRRRATKMLRRRTG